MKWLVEMKEDGTVKLPEEICRRFGIREDSIVSLTERAVHDAPSIGRGVIIELRFYNRNLGTDEWASTVRE